MTTLVTILQSLIFFGYTYYIYRRFGMLTSISASTYKLEGKQRWLFLLALGSTGVLNFFHFELMGAFGFFAGAFLAFAGVTIDHSERKAYSDIIHSVGTVGAIVLTYIGFMAIYGQWIPTALLIFAIIRLYKDKYFIWKIEIVAMIIAMIFLNLI